MDAPQKAAAARKRQRSIQRKVDRGDKGGKKRDTHPAMQAGARRYPVPPFPETHQKKPGNEAALKPAPLYDAPYWRGSGKLEGMAALITGGDSGIGRAVAVLFAREGADVAILHLGESRDAADTKKAVEAEGRRCIAIAGDVTDVGFCERAVAQTVERFGRLDILVNNAAFQYHAASIDELTDAHFEETIHTNLHGYFYMARAVLKHMGEGASIINTGSVTGIAGSAHLIDYSMTKGGIHAFTKALAGNLVSRGIRVNAVAPGPVWTPLNPSEKPRRKVAQFGADTPMKRPAQPEEIAPAYVFLASPQCSSYITGEILPIVGGY